MPMHRAEAWKGMAMSERASTRIDRDGRLLKALRRREPAAAELLVATYGDRAYRLASGISGNARDAEEVVQDAFWAVVRKIDTFRGESDFGSWFYRIVANTAYEKLRHRPGRRNEIALDEVLPRFLEGPTVSPKTSREPHVRRNGARRGEALTREQSRPAPAPVDLRASRLDPHTRGVSVHAGPATGRR